MTPEILIQKKPGETGNSHDCGFEDYWPVMGKVFGAEGTAYGTAWIEARFEGPFETISANNIREQLLAQVLGLTNID